jgi:hypothetical protein
VDLLADHSLVEVSSHEPRARHRLLEVVRQYAVPLLARSGDEDAVRRPRGRRSRPGSVDRVRKLRSRHPWPHGCGPAAAPPSLSPRPPVDRP